MTLCLPSSKAVQERLWSFIHYQFCLILLLSLLLFAICHIGKVLLFHLINKSWQNFLLFLHISSLKKYKFLLLLQKIFPSDFGIFENCKAQR